ncbi:hypothetical protein FRB94_002010 [Tulasnella sp. JGI-2019a]|nr:hypothetical protein FRB94_002010 [Tulasnella sp. JGI-2019a]
MGYSPVLREFRNMFTPSEDIDLAKRCAALMQETHAKRKEEEEKLRADEKVLVTKLAAAKKSAQRPANVPSATAHAQSISRLDDQRFALVKAIEEAEGTLNAKEADLSRQKIELKELEEKDVQNDHELDGTVERLSMYRELGFQLVEKTADNPAAIIIRSASDDVHCVNLDGSVPSFELTNRLWKLNST